MWNVFFHRIIRGWCNGSLFIKIVSTSNPVLLAILLFIRGVMLSVEQLNKSISIVCYGPVMIPSNIKSCKTVLLMGDWVAWEPMKGLNILSLNSVRLGILLSGPESFGTNTLFTGLKNGYSESDCKGRAWKSYIHGLCILSGGICIIQMILEYFTVCCILNPGSTGWGGGAATNHSFKPVGFWTRLNAT